MTYPMQYRDTTSTIKMVGNTRVEITIKNDNPARVYQEFGTGIIGAMSPYNDKKILQEIGWEYDVATDFKKLKWSNKFQMKTDMWVFQKDGKFYTTAGQKAHNVFFNSVFNANDDFERICKRYLERERLK